MIYFVSSHADVCSGAQFVDTLTLAAGIAIEAQSIGESVISSGFDGIDGILGYDCLAIFLVLLSHTADSRIGPRDLTCGVFSCFPVSLSFCSTDAAFLDQVHFFWIRIPASILLSKMPIRKFLFPVARSEFLLSRPILLITGTGSLHLEGLTRTNLKAR